MDTIIEDKDSLFTSVFTHLTLVQQSQSTPTPQQLDEELLRRADRALDSSSPAPLLWRILRTGETLLQSLRQDPRPLTRLLERTVLLIPFDELKSSISTEKLVEGLGSSSVPVQLLCLAYLRKAADLPSGAAFVAADSVLVQTLVGVWLGVESTEVAERGLEVLIALLAVDAPGTLTFVSSRGGEGAGEAEGQGLMWRRLFQDGEVYVLFFEWTSLLKSRHDLLTKKGLHAATVSQARLFDFVARAAALDWVAITTTVHGEIEREYAKATTSPNGQPFGGLLKYTANGMIDTNDYLMEVLRRDFFAKLLHVVEEENNKGVSSGLKKAIQDGAGMQQPDQGATNGMHL